MQIQAGKDSRQAVSAAGRLQNYDLSGRDFLAVNLAALAEHDPRLVELVRDRQDRPVGRLLVTEAGVPSIALDLGDGREVLAYGLEDPWQDAGIHFESVPEGARGLVVFVGMGLGYGPLLIHRERPQVQKLMVFEPSIDLFCLALRANDLTDIISSDRVDFYIGDDCGDFNRFEAAIGRLAALEDSAVLRHVPSFQWREEVYSELDRRVFMLINHINAHGGTTSKCGREFFVNRLKNLTLLPHSHDLETLRDTFKGRPAILVAAGPSLDQNLPEIEEVRDRVVLIAADSALAPLLNKGITPDFVTTLDFQAVNFEKCTGFLRDELSFSLVAMIKATPLVPKLLPARHLFFAFPEDRPHKWLVEALDIDELKVDASSVVHLSLGLALVIGADPIFLVGQDLAFTDRILDHASGTVFSGADVPADDELVHVKAINGGKVATSRNHLVSKKIFEDVFAAHQRRFFNGSAAGADIEGAPPLRISEGAEYFSEPLDVLPVIDQLVNDCPPVSITRLLGAIEEIFTRIRRLDRLFEKSFELAGKVEKKLARLKGKFFNALAELPPALRRQLMDFDRVNKELDADNDFWQQLMELTFNALNDNDRRRFDNKEIQGRKGYLPWLSVEIKRINQVNRLRRDSMIEYRDLLEEIVAHGRREGELLRNLEGGDPRAAGELAGLYLASGDLQLAKKIIDRLAAAEDCSAEILLQAAELNLKILDHSRAEELFARYGRVAGRTGDERRIRLEAAEFWLDIAGRHGDMYPRLLKIWLERIKRLINDPEALGPLLAGLFEQLSGPIADDLAGDAVNEAREKLTAWDETSQWLPAGFHSLWARLLLIEGRGREAAEHLHEACGKGPAAEDFAMLAKLMIETGCYQEGIGYLQRAVALEPKQAVMWEDFGDILAGADDFPGAITAYKQCSQALPGHWPALQKMGDCLCRTGEFEAARSCYRRVLAIIPEESGVKDVLEKVRKLVAG